MQHAARTAVRTLLFSTMIVSTTTGTAFSAGWTAAQIAASQIQQGVQQALSGERDLRPIEVSVEGNEVTLRGRVPTFWVKSEAIRKALDVRGVVTVASELEIPAVEDDNELAQEVARAILRYPYYTMWDYIGGVVNRGVVTLTGSVTPDRDKAGAVFERVAKVRGVQDVRSSIGTQPASSLDADLRYALASRMFNSIDFAEYAGWPNPPFHLIVDHSNVRLLGVVRSEIEKRRLEQLVSHTPGVLHVVNDLQTAR